MLSGLSPGAARSRAEGVTAKPTGASPVNLCAGISHFPQPRNKKGNHPTSGCYCLALFQSFSRSGFQSGLWTCRACGVGSSLQIDSVHQAGPKDPTNPLSLTSTPDLQSVREMTLWRWMTHLCTLTELRGAFGPHSMLFTPGFQNQSACTWAEAWQSHVVSRTHTAVGATMLTGCPEFPGLEQSRLEHPLLEIFRVCYNNSIQR